MPSTIAIDGSLEWSTAEVTLDGVEYLLETSWNTRDSRWYLALYAADGTALVQGVPIVVDYPLLRRFVGSIPPGYLMAVDTTGAGRELTTQDDLGVRVVLMYFDEAEVDAMEAA